MPDIVCYSSHGLNKEPFNNQTTFDHLNTELVRYSDPQCTIKIRTFWSSVFEGSNHSKTELFTIRKLNFQNGRSKLGHYIYKEEIIYKSQDYSIYNLYTANLSWINILNRTSVLFSLWQHTAIRPIGYHTIPPFDYQTISEFRPCCTGQFWIPRIWYEPIRNIVIA